MASTPGPRPHAAIVIDTKAPIERHEALLTHELVHWERGVQNGRDAPGGSWERAEEERVVDAIAGERMARCAED